MDDKILTTNDIETIFALCMELKPYEDKTVTCPICGEERLIARAKDEHCLSKCSNPDCPNIIV